MARSLAMAIVGRGQDVWFDEWEIKPGESIVGGIEQGLVDCDVFVIIWSASARASNWVGVEVRAIVRRRVDLKELRIIPILTDDTELPALVADYRGFELSDLSDIESIATEITGERSPQELAQFLQSKLNAISLDVVDSDNPIPNIVCPKCASTKLEWEKDFNIHPEGAVYFVMCLDCDWGASGKSKTIKSGTEWLRQNT